MQILPPLFVNICQLDGLTKNIDPTQINEDIIHLIFDEPFSDDNVRTTFLEGIKIIFLHRYKRSKL